jgi:hypothetical protein
MSTKMPVRMIEAVVALPPFPRNLNSIYKIKTMIQYFLPFQKVIQNLVPPQFLKND